MTFLPEKGYILSNKNVFKMLLLEKWYDIRKENRKNYHIT